MEVEWTHERRGNKLRLYFSSIIFTYIILQNIQQPFMIKRLMISSTSRKYQILFLYLYRTFDFFLDLTIILKSTKLKLPSQHPLKNVILRRGYQDDISSLNLLHKINKKLHLSSILRPD